MAKSTPENCVPSTDELPRGRRPVRDQRDTGEAARDKPARRRVNEITSAIGLTPITGRSGPRIAY